MTALSLPSFSSLIQQCESLSALVETRMAELVRVSLPSTLVGALSHHLDSGGQRVRARLALHAGRALNLSDDDAVTIAVTVELLHNASLIHDDLQDRDLQRRGCATLWSAFGENVAICAGDLLLSAAYGNLCRFSDSKKLPQLLAQVHAATASAVHGQCADLSGQACDIALYEKIAAAKSGALLALPLELVLIATGQENYLAVARQAADAFAVGYQIVDDIDDIDKDRGSDGQPDGLNACLILAAGHGGYAHMVARQLALARFEQATQSASWLPHGAGVLLASLAQRLSAQL
ncbi:polyprenyl synthetase family protein [Actimicrobium sp. CCI2.3]|uniref:polyprenyl synthetase family protein n=1 Tax=Actimicrobium sp. CCI2.3 TaxID=3048616 RepID=UPI002AB4E36F|nr:polyprenyl synthetase family protein [Actimicrobium sp. CCI2.3]MDY7575449.1 polyprenyl synthetase family protein [Actimicrobium sp. CCI2.3]MEB0021360.1 polyprenyl synthetase family protein [Actimicrobium sp. CCI2.3]